jgi:proline iminopeptidase
MAFAAIEPFASGLLPVSDGNEIYWEASGKRSGKPALYLHGGPGGGMKAGYRRWFDPATHLIVGFEQRGCGRSRPLVTDDLATLRTNTTPRLIEDIEALRTHLDVDRWLLAGVSWGTTLALAYAQAHPDRVSEIALLAVSTTTRREVEWITESMGRLFPEEWEVFRAAANTAPGERLVDAYYRLLTDPDPALRSNAATAWNAWEDTHISLAPNWQPSAQPRDEVRAQVFATLVTHYWSHDGFLADAQLLSAMPRIAHLPGVLVHGRYDISGPPDVPWALHQAWQGSRYELISSEGHGGAEMVEALCAAIADFPV